MPQQSVNKEKILPQKYIQIKDFTTEAHRDDHGAHRVRFILLIRAKNFNNKDRII